MIPRRLQLALRRNMGLKVLSVGLALCVWIYVNSQGQETFNFAVPIEPVGLPEDMVLTHISETSADVRLTGRESDLSPITIRHIHAYLDLSHVQEGEQWIALGVDDVSISRPVEVAQIMPRQVRVRIEPRVTRTLKVVADVVGSPPEGIDIARITVEPAEVTASGGAKALRGLSRIRTQPIDLSEIVSSIRRETRLDLGGRDLEIKDGSSVYVTINVQTPDKN
ncbi:MAG: YbbR-like domain-containing protein [Leptospirillia bacterium]